MSSIRIADFDTWRPGYGLATVRVLQANTAVLASIFTDQALTIPAPNPQTLIERIDGSGGISYGRFGVPLYVGVPYQLQINTVDQTGVIAPPITTLVGQDASLATVVVTGGTQTINVDDALARRIDARDYGAFVQVGQQGASSATNTATLVAAIGVAGGASGGYVELPAGTYQVNAITIPLGVVLRGQGRAATTLQSNVAGNVVTIGGMRAGLSRLTLDGITLITNSVGVSAQMIDQLVLEDAEIKRFDTGIYRKGGKLAEWRDLYISNCNTGYKGHGESFNNLGVGTAPLTHNTWRGGRVDTCGTVGVEFVFVDSICQHNTIEGVIFDTNTGTAVKIVGAQWTKLSNCDWNANTVDLNVADTALTNTPLNTVLGLDLVGGSMNAEIPAVGVTPAVPSTILLSGTLETVAFRQMDLENIAVTITTPSHNIVVEDCEQNNISFSGSPNAWTTARSDSEGTTFGITTGNASTEAWAVPLAPGQQVYLEAKVVGRQRNNVNTGFFHVSISGGAPGASLQYDTRTATFLVGNVLTGATSGATARITADTNGAGTGTFTLQDIVGTFKDDEIITDGSGGSALVSGTITINPAVLLGALNHIRPSQKTDATWDAVFLANNNQIELHVNGNTGQAVEWTCDVLVTRT